MKRKIAALVAASLLALSLFSGCASSETKGSDKAVASSDAGSANAPDPGDNFEVVEEE